MSVKGYIGLAPINSSKPCARKRSSQNVPVDRGILFCGTDNGKA